MIIVESFGMRDAGRVREINEDVYAVVEPEESTEAEELGRLFVVADGMGHEGAGEVAARLAVDTVVEVYYSGEGGADPEEAIRYSVERAHLAIRETASEHAEYHKMGATLTAMAQVEDHVFIAHVGDTRAYVVRRGQIIQLTNDHNWAGEQLRKGAITKVHAATHPRRKVLTRSLGQTPHVEVDTRVERIEPGDVFLLCTDGLYDTLGEDELQRVLAETGPQLACRELVARANRNSGSDNIAAIAIKTSYEGKPFLSREKKRKFSLPEISIPRPDIKLPAALKNLSRLPTMLPIYLAGLALAAFIIIGTFSLLRECGGEQKPPDTATVTTTKGDGEKKEEQRAKVKITTAPSGAIIKVDGARVGPSPITVDLKAGTHEIEINHEGYQVKRHKLEIEPGEEQIPLNFILVPHPAERTPDMVFVSAGFFIMGRDGGSPDESPAHKIYLDAFYIDRYEVSNKQYKKFLEETERQPPGFWDDPERNAPNLPVVGVDWADAKAYCEWAKKRLPTEAEWEKAARGAQGWLYPWGNEFDDAKANIKGEEDGYADVAPVGALPEGRSTYGAYNMIGNVAEWTNDYFDPEYYSYMPMKNPTGPDSGTRKVLRGGSFRTGKEYANVTYRSAFAPQSRKPYIGFRCAKD